jgi:hypothetical protein
MYAQDNDDRFCDPDFCYFSQSARYPVESGVGGSNHLHLRWCNGDLYLQSHPEYGGSLYPYMKDARAFIRPTYARLTIRGSQYQFYMADDDTIKNYKPWYNYTMNAYLSPIDTPRGQPLKGVRVEKLTKVKRPGETFSFTEESALVDTRYNASGLNDTFMIPGDKSMAEGWLKALAGALGLLNPVRKEWANSEMLSQVPITHHPATSWAEKGIALSYMGMLLLIHAQKRFH